MKTMTLAELRKQNKLTQEVVAEKLGVSVTTVSNWENGINRPSDQNLLKLSKIYGIPELSLLQNLYEQNESKKGGVEEFPDYIFTDSDFEYLKQLNFSIVETEFIRQIAVYENYSDNNEIVSGLLQEYNPKVLRCLSDSYCKNHDVMELNIISYNVWDKLLNNRFSTEQGEFPYKIIWDYICKFLFANPIGQQLDRFSLVDFPKDMILNLADDFANTRWSLHPNHWFPTLSNLALVISLIDCDHFYLKNFYKYLDIGILDNYSSFDESVFAYFYLGDIHNWVTMEDGNGLLVADETTHKLSVKIHNLETDKYVLTSKGQEFLNALNNDCPEIKERLVNQYLEWEKS